MRPVVPRVVDVAAVAPDDVDRRQVLRRREAGGDDDRVDLALDAVGGDDAVLGDARDRVGDELEVRLVERRVVDVREQRPLAAERMRRPELAPHLGIVARRRSPPGRRPRARRSSFGSANVMPLFMFALDLGPEREQRRRDRRGTRRAAPACRARRSSGAPSSPCAGTGGPGPAAFTISGTNCTALAALPMTATRSPARS